MELFKGSPWVVTAWYFVWYCVPKATVNYYHMFQGLVK